MAENAADAANPSEPPAVAEAAAGAEAPVAAQDAAPQPMAPEPEPEVIEPVTLGQSLPTQAKPVPA